MKPQARKRLLCISAFLLGSVFYLSFPQDSLAQREAFAPKKRYVLYGAAELAYERRWLHEGGGVLSTFTQNYNLGLRGYVLDPKLVNFDVSGLLTDSARNTGEDYTLRGVNLNLTLLERLPPKLGGVWSFIPNPIRLRYSHYSNHYESTNYGVSLMYSLEKLKPKKDGNGKNGAHSLWPTFVFDYDRYDYGQANYNLVTDVYALRSSMAGKHYVYKFLYEDREQKGLTEYKRRTLELQPDYTFYNEETRRSLEITNLLRMTEDNEIRNLNLRSNQRWFKSVGTDDSLLFLGSVGYASAVNGEKAESYDASLSSQYRKVFSPRLADTVSLALGFGQSDARNTHSERLSNAVEMDISKLLRGTGSVFLGNTQYGRDVGAGVSLSTKTRRVVAAGYFFESLRQKNGETLRHRLELRAAGPIIRSMTFDAELRYKTEEVSSPVSPYSENSLYGSANLFWQLRKTSLSLGGNYTLTEKKNGETVETKYTSIYGSLSRVLTRRIFLNVYSTWTLEERNKKETLEIKPRLSWAERQTSVALEYDYRRVKENNSAASGEHRIMVRASRKFGRR